MTKQIRTTKAAATVRAFSIEAWASRLEQSAAQFTGAGKQMLDLMLEARGKVEPDTAREKLLHAFASAYAATYGVTFDEACKAKTVCNRVSDGMAVLKAENLPDSLPGNIQQAAAACRKANPSGRKVAPRTPKAPAATVEARDVKPLALLQTALNLLKAEAGDNETVLSLVGDMVDLAGELAEALAAEAKADKAAKTRKRA